MDQRRQSVRALMRALPSLDQLLALPRRRFDEAAAGLGRGLELNTINKRRGFERVASHLRPDVLSNRITERRQLLSERMARAERTVERLLDRSKSRIDRAEAILASLPARLKTQTGRGRERLGNLSRHADTAIRHQLTRARAELSAQDRVLQSLSYKNVLKRGYAVIRDEDNRPVSQAAALSAGMGIAIEFADGRVGAMTTEGGNPPAGAKKRGAKSAEPPKQGSLF
jgi:exodeoxyribonuclease VII large subunit